MIKYREYHTIHANFERKGYKFEPFEDVVNDSSFL